MMRRRLAVYFFLLLGSLFFPRAFSLAADLGLTPAAGSYQVGDVFPVTVFIASPDQAINAVQGSLNFPVDKLQVVNLTKASTVGLWVAEPTFSNQTGTVNFEGVILNPGFRGGAGNVIVVNLRARAPGNASLAFSQAAVLANDGLGTNVLKNLGVSHIAIGPTAGTATTPAPVPTVPLPLNVAVPLPVAISSPTHPESDKWYADPNPTFNWELGRDITAVRLLYDKYPTSQPSVLYAPAITKKSLKDIKDGVYYFHVQARNTGGWGAVSHFRFQIDTEKPTSFELAELAGSDSFDPRPTFSLTGSDALSGLGTFELKVGDREPIIVPAALATATVYSLPALEPGSQTLIARALDRAGNYLTDYLNFVVESLLPPTITDYPARIAADQVVTLKGETYPEAEVTIWYGRTDGETIAETVMSDAVGQFVFSYDASQLKNGVYLFSAGVKRSDGLTSPRSTPVITVVERSWLDRVSGWTVNFLTLFVPLVALLIILILLVLSTYRRLARYRYHVKKEVREAEDTLARAFDLLREDLRDHLSGLEKAKTLRALTAEETKIMTRMKNDLNEAEKIVRKEIKDISA